MSGSFNHSGGSDFFSNFEGFLKRFKLTTENDKDQEIFTLSNLDSGYIRKFIVKKVDESSLFRRSSKSSLKDDRSNKSSRNSSLKKKEKKPKERRSSNGSLKNAFGFRTKSTANENGNIKRSRSDFGLSRSISNGSISNGSINSTKSDGALPKKKKKKSSFSSLNFKVSLNSSSESDCDLPISVMTAKDDEDNPHPGFSNPAYVKGDFEDEGIGGLGKEEKEEEKESSDEDGTSETESTSSLWSNSPIGSPKFNLKMSPKPKRKSKKKRDGQHSPVSLRSGYQSNRSSISSARKGILKKSTSTTTINMEMGNISRPITPTDFDDEDGDPPRLVRTATLNRVKFILDSGKPDNITGDYDDIKMEKGEREKNDRVGKLADEENGLSKSGRKCLLFSAGVLIVTMAVILGSFFGSRKSGSQLEKVSADSLIKLVDNAIEGYFLISNEVFADYLQDFESQEFKNISSKLEETMMKVIFLEESINQPNSTTRLKIVKYEKGSIRATFRIRWTGSNALKLSEIRKRVDAHLNQYGAFGDYKVNKSSFIVKELRNQCHEQLSCSHLCDLSEVTLRFGCTCPDLLILVNNSNCGHPKIQNGLYIPSVPNATFIHIQLENFSNDKSPKISPSEKQAIEPPKESITIIEEKISKFDEKTEMKDKIQSAEEPQKLPLPSKTNATIIKEISLTVAKNDTKEENVTLGIQEIQSPALNASANETKHILPENSTPLNMQNAGQNVTEPTPLTQTSIVIENAKEDHKLSSTVNTTQVASVNKISTDGRENMIYDEIKLTKEEVLHAPLPVNQVGDQNSSKINEPIHNSIVPDNNASSEKPTEVMLTQLPIMEIDQTNSSKINETFLANTHPNIVAIENDNSSIAPTESIYTPIPPIQIDETSTSNVIKAILSNSTDSSTPQGSHTVANETDKEMSTLTTIIHFDKNITFTTDLPILSDTNYNSTYKESDILYAKSTSMMPPTLVESNNSIYKETIITQASPVQGNSLNETETQAFHPENKVVDETVTDGGQTSIKNDNSITADENILVDILVNNITSQINTFTITKSPNFPSSSPEKSEGDKAVTTNTEDTPLSDGISETSQKSVVILNEKNVTLKTNVIHSVSIEAHSDANFQIDFDVIANASHDLSIHHANVGNDSIPSEIVQNVTALQETSSASINIDHEAVCKDGEFTCLSGGCIAKSSRCDSVLDCPDGSDEQQCIGNNCHDNHQCRWNADCLERKFVCDGIKHCADADDEEGCDTWKCTEDEFTCGAESASVCIPLSLKCDGHSDCFNSSDEVNCFSSCSNDQFLCEEGKCIPKVWLCDGSKDCFGGEDEKNCGCDGLDQSPCAVGGCVTTFELCDGLRDCPDGSDEWGCLKIDAKTKQLHVRSNKGRWSSVCGDKWTSQWTDLACEQLGLGVSLSTEVKRVTDLVPTLRVKLSPDESEIPRRGRALLQYYFVHGECSSDSLVHISCKNPECGLWSFSSPNVILHGETEKINMWPSLGLLVQPEAFIDRVTAYSYSCSASIITSTWVLAAYSCLSSKSNGLEAEKWELLVGEKSSKVGFAKQIVRYPGAKRISGLWVGDAALLRLETPLAFDSITRPICLSSQPAGIHDQCIIASWNSNAKKNSKGLERRRSQDIQSLPVPNLTLNTCNTSYYNGHLKQEHVCASFTQAKQSTCLGNEGSPLMCRRKDGDTWYLQGLMSHVGHCARFTFPSVFTDVSSIESWVLKTIGLHPTRELSPTGSPGNEPNARLKKATSTSRSSNLIADIRSDNSLPVDVEPH